MAGLPKTIEEVKEYAHSMIVDVPLPEWMFQMLGMLNDNPEVQASMSVSYVRVRKYRPPYWLCIFTQNLTSSILLLSLSPSSKFALELDCVRGQCHAD